MILAATAVSMMLFFRAEVVRQAAAEGIAVPSVVVVQPLPTSGPWAWVGNCVPGFECDEVIYVRQDFITFMGYDALKVVALHEVLHVKYGDNVGSLTEAEMQRRHRRIWRELDKKLDVDTLEAARTETNWWRKRWSK